MDISSEGCEDPGKGRGCGQAYIWVNGRDRSLHRRGFNVVVLNAYNGKCESCSMTLKKLDLVVLLRHFFKHDIL